MNKAIAENEVMRLSRQKGSHDYYAGAGWSADPAHARTFLDSLEAAHVCAQEGLKDVELGVRVRGAKAISFARRFLEAKKYQAWPSDIG